MRDELRQKEEIVLVSDPLIKEAEGVDLKTREIRAILIRQDSFQQMLSYFLSVYPSKMSTDNIDITNEQISFVGKTSDPKIIKSFLDRLRKDKAFKLIDLGSIKRQEDSFQAPFKLQGFIPKQ